MRLLAGLAIALSFGATTGVDAQIPRPVGAADLKDAAFAPDKAPKIRQDDFSNMVEREQFAPDGAPVRWTTNNFQIGKTERGSVDNLRLSVGGAVR